MQQTTLDDLGALLARVRRRWLARRSMLAAGRVAGAAAGLLLLVLFTDHALQPADAVMVWLFAAALGLAAGLAGRALWRLRRAPGDRQVARYIEERCPALEERLVSAADSAAAARPSVFRDLLLRDAARTARAVDVERVLPRRDVLLAVAGGGLAVAALLLVVVLGGGPLGRIARTTWLHAFPHAALLQVEPGDARVVAGRPVRLRAVLRSGVGGATRSVPVVTVTAGDGTERALEMAAARGAYQLDVPAVDASFTYRVQAASLTSDEYAITAVFPPRVSRIDVAYRYPAHTGLPPRVEADGGDIHAPAGTRVTVSVRTSKAVDHGWLELGAGARFPLAAVDGVLAASFDVLADDTYRVRLRDADGLTNARGSDYFIRTVQDRAPAVEIVRPAGDREITPLEEVTVEARAIDDFGLARFELVYGVMGRPERVVSLGAAAGAAAAAARASGTYTIFGEDLQLRPGDFLTYHVRARDTAPGRRAAVRSDIYFLQVRPFDREFEQAPSQGDAGPETEDLRRLADVQKEIIVATWKLDGEPEAARSSEDVETVADAQGDLKLAARLLAARLRGPVPQVVPGDAPGGDALGLAIDAMAAAETELRGLRTAAAIAPEMAAFNQLLRAQASMGPTQVTQRGSQRGPGGGMGAREDLSALFDRDLRRDQQTNYEHRSPSEAPDEAREEDEVRRRLRALAERQAALNRQQEELARERALETGERRRRLERLAREQEEIRRRADDLRRALAQRGEPGDPQQQQEEQSAARAMRDAVERMQRAASELGQGDVSQAAREGRQALDGLRRLGQRLGGERTGGRGRQVDLQLEAQQLADAQREVAAAAGGSRGRLADRSTRRQLAEREDHLADRVESLAERIEQSQPAAEPAAQAALEAAARELRQAEVAQRLRAFATALRAAAGAGSAEREALEPELPAQLAAALQRVATELSGAGEPDEDTRRLAEELAESQRLRDRLARIEEQLADGSPGARSGAQPEGQEAGAGGGLGELADLLQQLGEGRPDLARDLERWARDWRSGAAPGTEAYKQDLSAWPALYGELRYVLEALEASRSRALAADEAADRLQAGAGAATPESYRRLVDRYYRSLAARPTPR